MLYIETVKNDNITCIDRGLAKLKEARCCRMQNDVSANEKLSKEGVIKKDTFPLVLCQGVEQKTELCTLV